MQSSFYSEARIVLFVSLFHLLHFQAIYQHSYSYPFSCSYVYDDERETRSQAENIWTIMTLLSVAFNGFCSEKSIWPLATPLGNDKCTLILTFKLEGSGPGISSQLLVCMTSVFKIVEVISRIFLLFIIPIVATLWG